MDQSMSPDHWMNLSTFWTSKMESQAAPLTTNSSARSVRKTSGLFDVDLTADKTDLAGNDSVSVDFLSLDDGLLTQGEAFDFDKMLGDNAFGFDPLGESSLDSFVDLSTFLMEETSEDKGMTEPITEKTMCKRPLELSCVMPEDIVNMEEVLCPSTPDHDYVSKKPRLSPLSEASTSTSAAAVVDMAPPCTVTHEDKYRERRRKNNIASRRSREIRKQKFAVMDDEAERLRVENDHLRKKIADLEKMAKEMKAILVAKLAGK